jgi:hypothetical protein
VADPTAVKSWRRGQLLWPRYWPRIIGKDKDVGLTILVFFCFFLSPRCLCRAAFFAPHRQRTDSLGRLERGFVVGLNKRGGCRGCRTPRAGLLWQEDAKLV